MYTRKSRAGHSNNAHSSVSMSSSTKGVQSRTRLVDCNLGWRGPIISESELAKLGTELELLRAAPPGVLISDICEGKNSYKTFQPIASAFPWDNPKLSKPVPGKALGSHWSIRRTLMQATAPLSQQGGIRSENRQPPPLLKTQQPQFSSWTKGASYVQLPWHKPYSQIPKQPAAYGSLAVPILSRSLLGGAAEKAGCTNNNTVCTDNLSDRNQINESCNRQIYVVQQQQQQQQQQQKHSTMAHSFNLPNSVVIDCTVNEKEVAPRLIYLPQATDRSESGSHNPRRIASDAVLSTVSRENSSPVNAPRCTSGIGGEGRPLASFNSPESGDKLNFYSANNDSLTDGEAEESVLDLSSSPDEGSESSDEGLYSDSPSSSIDEKESQKIARPVSCTGGIAEGMRLGQIADGGAAVISECVSCLTFIPGVLPPSTTRCNEGDSRGHVALLPHDIGTVACPEGKNNTCQALSSVANLYPTGDLKRIIGQSGCPIQRCISAEQRAFSASCDVSPIDHWSDRGKENCSATESIVNFNSDALRSLGCSLRLDLKLQPHSVTVCTVEKEKTAYGAGAGAGAGTGTGLSHKAVSQGEKRKLYDTVAIMSDSRGGRGKRPKSSMRVASIKSFFAPR